MSTYIIFSMGEPKYKVEAYFYDVDKHFMSFYDEDDNIICSINIDEIDYVVDKEYTDKIHIIEPVDEEECADCDEIECECHPSKFEIPTDVKTEKDKPKYTVTMDFKPMFKSTDKKSEHKETDNFDELFKRVLGLHGEK